MVLPVIRKATIGIAASTFAYGGVQGGRDLYRSTPHEPPLLRVALTVSGFIAGGYLSPLLVHNDCKAWLEQRKQKAQNL